MPENNQKPNPAQAQAQAVTETGKGGLPAETPAASPTDAEADLASRARTEDLTGQPEGGFGRRSGDSASASETPVSREEFDKLVERVAKVEKRNAQW